MVHDGGIDELWLSRVVGRAEPVLFFTNDRPYRDEPDSGYRVFATGAHWNSAVLMGSAPHAQEFAVGEFGGRIRFGEWLAPDSGAWPVNRPLSWADYCFPRSGP